MPRVRVVRNQRGSTSCSSGPAKQCAGTYSPARGCRGTLRTHYTREAPGKVREENNVRGERCKVRRQVLTGCLKGDKVSKFPTASSWSSGAQIGKQSWRRSRLAPSHCWVHWGCLPFAVWVHWPAPCQPGFWVFANLSDFLRYPAPTNLPLPVWPLV